ncbi:phosphopantothenoylcysteine decarboxylase/phosphopantothenate--cysteine ligase [Kineosphaera limosa]|uniref:Coenzyme A biosynthesis bifunctional protein CoaBC n=1 Tax=Kineosphaera limosa NBRC 100340 TaxID=1184609 RepID=K6XC03_9MICO|nr:bifunctional phosphopantothenoylcysteine decarboxylase/phosphopantothenate synthase [Kineosphaera limosa]NYD99150.1 phosphopantothenoylcysteine decarboxylase/phosphopantothenate--cysteine ligase [Kineosphaera limosa]GAB96314.1 coenzyme A biosynthesis bifunctional protein CoaBC [Kineosphaera limosa NBRC 100340]
MSRIVLGVGGGIAAYKAASLLRRLTETGHDVTVVPTASALKFVGAPTWSALSGKPVTANVFDDVHEVRHVRLGQEADLVVVAPATADLIAKAATGLADDLLTNVLLTAHGPVVLAPAMHTEMWQHPATVANIARLRSRNVHVIEPASGRLTGADTGPGRMPEPEEIHTVCLQILGQSDPSLDAGAGAAPGGDTAPGGPAGTTHANQPALYAVPQPTLAGLRVVISAGGTREALDPVRFLGNRSSGKQGLALAQVAAERGAQVTLVAANVSLPAPPGVQVVPVESALDLAEAMTARADDADVLVMAAAVADFRPKQYVDAKIKKTHAPGHEDDAPVIELTRNPDILAALVQRRRERGTARPVIVGFAAETGDDEGDVLHHARAKLARKGCDLLIANEVGRDVTFGKDESTVHVLVAGSTAEPVTIGPAPKASIAAGVWDAVQQLLAP